MCAGGGGAGGEATCMRTGGGGGGGGVKAWKVTRGAVAGGDVVGGVVVVGGEGVVGGGGNAIVVVVVGAGGGAACTGWTLAAGFELRVAPPHAAAASPTTAVPAARYMLRRAKGIVCSSLCLRPNGRACDLFYGRVSPRDCREQVQSVCTLRP